MVEGEESVQALDPRSFEVLSERGRQLAASMLRENLEKRKQLEETFGKDFCMRRYPEVYRNLEFEDSGLSVFAR